jgi:hypothetical protein
VLLWGDTGVGKTSLIKAIANDTKRHIFNIKLKKETTKAQLLKLFYEDEVCVASDDKNKLEPTKYKIALDTRMYVIEDIDCLTDILNKRADDKKDSLLDKLGIKGENLDNALDIDDIDNNETVKYKLKQRCESDKQQAFIDLSFMLNLLDGILECNNRLLIITSNYPEKIDPALLRASRIDIKLKLNYCNLSMIREMYNHTFNLKKTFRNIKCTKNITAAEVMQIIQENFDTPKDAYNQLILKMQ